MLRNLWSQACQDQIIHFFPSFFHTHTQVNSTVMAAESRHANKHHTLLQRLVWTTKQETVPFGFQKTQPASERAHPSVSPPAWVASSSSSPSGVNTDKQITAEQKSGRGVYIYFQQQTVNTAALFSTLSVNSSTASWGSMFSWILFTGFVCHNASWRSSRLTIMLNQLQTCFTVIWAYYNNIFKI